jgi:hypothetical protein
MSIAGIVASASDASDYTRSFACASLERLATPSKMAHVCPGMVHPVKPPMQGQFMSAARPYHAPQSKARQRHLWLLSLVIIILGVTAALGALGQLPSSAWLTRPASVVRDPLSSFPPIIVWAWERPESLDFIDTQAVGIAFLARTLYLRGPEVIVRPRLQPFSAPHGTKLMAVVRMVADRWRPPDLSASQQDMATAAIAEVSGLAGIQALQVDFDATVSQRGFYRDVLQQLRRHLPASMPLSMTALASWCIFDDWLTGLPVDEVVPMVFRMGADHHRVRRYLAEDDFRAAACRRSVGISTDELLPTVRGGRRLYIFHPHAWRPEAMTRILEEVGRWPQQP